MQPKILIGCPTSDVKAYCLNQYIEGIRNLAHDSFDILLVDNSSGDDYFQRIKAAGIPVVKGKFFSGAKDRIVFARNLLRQKVLDDYDYFFSLEQDVIPPKDIIERLLKYNKKVITAVYFAHNKFPDGKTELMPLVYKLIKDRDMRPLNQEELWENPGLIKVVSCGLGCVLIHRSVLEQVKFRYERDVFDDRFFCTDLLDKKIPIYCDTRVKCKHLIFNRPYPWSKIKK